MSASEGYRLSALPDAAAGLGAAGERWFAVWTRNQYEPKVEGALERKGLHVFLPRLRVPSRRRDRRVVLDQPLFPGYLFLRFAPSRETYVRVAGTDGVVRVLGERVRIVAGLLAGVEGLVQTWHAGRATFVVSVDLLQRSVGVELDAGVLERL
ncbi:MAG: hypothetical protein E6J68_13240 [Deltaproteobacteria bacterium]|nr:MAG: hypothetical protein E6J68_13240 [Deltaproteobacteria bacterium]